MSGSKGDLIKGIAWDIGERVLALFPGADIPLVALRHYMQYTFEESQRALKSAISSGDLEKLNEKEKQKLIPIGYRFYEAVRAGMAKNNMRILASVISGMIRNRDIKVNTYGIIESSVKNLSFHELVILGCYVKVIRETSYDFNSYKKDIGSVQKLTYRVHDEAKKITEDLNDELIFLSCQSVLSAFGWLFPFLVSFDNPNLYAPTKMIYFLLDIDILSLLENDNK